MPDSCPTCGHTLLWTSDCLTCATTGCPEYGVSVDDDEDDDNDNNEGGRR